MAENKTDPRVKEFYDYAQGTVDEQAILDKFNAATRAQFDVQREQNRQAENKFYNQMYNTQRTAMDTIRKSNAAAVSSGASRGVQAANELSALLGLQQESVQSATEIAQQNRQTAQEETAAVLENVLKAYQQASQERSQLTQQGIEAASLEATEQQASAQNKEAETNRARLITEAAENGTETYLTALQQAGIDYSDGKVTPDSITSFNAAINNIGKTKDGNAISFEGRDWAGIDKSASVKADKIVSTINTICDTYGLDKSAYADELKDLQKVASNTNVSWIGSWGGSDEVFNKYGLGDATQKNSYAEHVNGIYQHLLNRLRTDYANGANRKK